MSIPASGSRSDMNEINFHGPNHKWILEFGNEFREEIQMLIQFSFHRSGVLMASRKVSYGCTAGKWWNLIIQKQYAIAFSGTDTIRLVSSTRFSHARNFQHSTMKRNKTKSFGNCSTFGYYIYYFGVIQFVQDKWPLHPTLWNMPMHPFAHSLTACLTWTENSTGTKSFLVIIIVMIM